MKGVDPLFLLNHFCYLDSARKLKQKMTFSRYAGPGSHRLVDHLILRIASWKQRVIMYP